jgi:hypothetical protein
MNTTTSAIVAIVGLVVTLPPSFVALRALVRRQGRVHEDPGQSIRLKQQLRLANFLTYPESCNAPNRMGETLELSNVTPEPPTTANSGSVGLADVGSNTQNEQLEKTTGFSGACDQVCKEERVPNHEHGQN